MLASKTWCFLEEVNFQAGFVGEENLVAVRVFGAKQKRPQLTATSQATAAVTEEKHRRQRRCVGCSNVLAEVGKEEALLKRFAFSRGVVTSVELHPWNEMGEFLQPWFAGGGCRLGALGSAPRSLLWWLSPVGKRTIHLFICPSRNWLT